jgi:hypothetical protein
MIDLQPYMSTLVVALIVLAAIILATLIYKLLTHRVRGRRGQRLGISEFHEIDKSRRLVLIRRDDVEHLVLIGGGQDVVIESGIGTGLSQEIARSPAIGGSDPIPMRAPPRPAVFGGVRTTLRPVEPTMGRDDDHAS